MTSLYREKKSLSEIRVVTDHHCSPAILERFVWKGWNALSLTLGKSYLKSPQIVFVKNKLVFSQNRENDRCYKKKKTIRIRDIIFIILNADFHAETIRNSEVNEKNLSFKIYMYTIPVFPIVNKWVGKTMHLFSCKLTPNKNRDIVKRLRTRLAFTTEVPRSILAEKWTIEFSNDGMLYVTCQKLSDKAAWISSNGIKTTGCEENKLAQCVRIEQINKQATSN